MKQLTKEEAIEFYKSEKWKNCPDKTLVGLQLFQKKLCIPFNVFHEAIERVLKRPVWTHEFGLNYDGIVAEYLGQAPKPSWEDIIKLIPKDKQIVLVEVGKDESNKRE